MKTFAMTRGAGTDDRPLVVGIGGTTRHGSSSECALMVSLRAAEHAGARIAWITADDLVLPLYGTGGGACGALQDRLTTLMGAADGVIISSPSYHGTISGLVKNALDYIEELREDARPYLDGRAIGLIACAAGWQGAGQTMSSLRSIAHALRGWPTPYGAVLNTSSRLFDSEGACTDAAVQQQLETVARQVVEFARLRLGANTPREQALQREAVTA